MIPVSCYRDQSVVVMGLSRTGLSAASALQRGGAVVIGWDDQEKNRLLAQERGVPLLPLEEIKWDKVAALMLSPGIPHRCPSPHPAAVLANQHQIPILCDIDLLAQMCPDAYYMGITGTNGKSTTTALIGELVQAAGRSAQVGGNIGRPVLDLDPFRSEGTYILELSSYQLERVPHLTVNIAVWLNITPDHLERHGGLEGYVAAKRHLFTPWEVPQQIAMSIDDVESKKIYSEISQDPAKTVVPVSMTQPLKGGVFVQEGVLMDDFFDGRAVLDLRTLEHLRGLHNWQNVSLAYAAVRLHNLPFDLHTLQAFKGLPHRQELCGIREGIHFINDSKATNIASTLTAVSAYENVFLILGGQPKESLLEGIEIFKDRILGTYLIGEAASIFKKTLSRQGIPCRISGTLEMAVKEAFSDAQANPLPMKTVLLSPACASFDQFKDYEHRGAVFKECVSSLL
jgi:UDP-N-acetylmuramoylalanine--D-glutamate ligase